MTAAPRRRPRSLLDTLPLVALPVALALPPLLAAAAIALLLATWLLRRPARRELLAAPLVALAALLMLAAGVAARVRAPDPRRVEPELETRYRALWADIDRHAREAARA